MQKRNTGCDHKATRRSTGYVCQYCGKTSRAKDWENDRCPKCLKRYDAILAQESEE